MENSAAVTMKQSAFLKSSSSTTRDFRASLRYLTSFILEERAQTFKDYMGELE